MGLYREEAVVLRTRDYAEADKLLTLYTRTRGKVQAIAKGVRKPKSRMRGGIQALSFSDFQLFEGRSLDTVTQCEVREAFMGLRQDLKKLAYATYLAELLEGMVPEREGNERVFLLFLTVLHLVEHGDREELAARLFEVRLMGLLGYRPETGACVHCGKAMYGRGAWFSARLGGVLCPQCRMVDSWAVPVTAGTLAVMEQLLRMDVKMFSRLQVAPQLAEELGELMRSYIQCRMERHIRSLDFIEQIRRV